MKVEDEEETSANPDRGSERRRSNRRPHFDSNFEHIPIPLIFAAAIFSILATAHLCNRETFRCAIHLSSDNRNRVES